MFRKIHTLVIAVVGMMVFSLTSVAEPQEITIEEAVRTALMNNMTIRQQEIGLAQAKLAYRRSWNAFLPSLSASSTLSRSNKISTSGYTVPVDITNPGADLENGQLYDYVLYLDGSDMDISPSALSLSLQGSLALNAGMFMAPEGTKMKVESGKLSIESSRSQVVRDVRKGYYNLLLMRENITLMEENLATAEARYEQTKVNYENGLVPELSMLQARVGWESMKPALENLRILYQISLMQFKANIGMSQDEEIEPVGTIPEPAKVDLEQEASIPALLSDRYDIRRLVSSIEQLRHGRKTTLVSSMTPSLVFSASYAPMIANAFSENTNWSGEDNSWTDRGSLSVTLSLPVDSWIPFSSSWTRIQDMDMNIESMEETLEQTMLLSEIEVHSLLMNMEKSLESIEALKANVELARKAYELTETAYRAGSKDFLEVQNASAELSSAQLELLKEKYIYVSALLDLEYALNLDLTGFGLQAEQSSP